MSLEKLVSKYIASTEHALNKMQIAENSTKTNADSIGKVVESAKAYLQDAKYYRERKRFEVSLASVAYCEGLLDALKMLGAVEFEWPIRKRKRRSEK